jgi:hypothetical protein
MTNATNDILGALTKLTEIFPREWGFSQVPMEIRLPKHVFTRLVFDVCRHNKIDVEQPLESRVLTLNTSYSKIRIVGVDE